MPKIATHLPSGCLRHTPSSRTGSFPRCLSETLQGPCKLTVVAMWIALEHRALCDTWRCTQFLDEESS
jgi:hypothetical protein